ncbi:MAG: RNA polymerase sigma factor [Pseudomonadota bacterium]
MTMSSPSLARLVLVRQGETAGAKVPDAFAAPALPDAELARALVRGDKDAPYAAWLRFAPAARGNLRRLLGPGFDEDDLCQEVFLRFFQRVPGLRDPDAIRGFLFAVCLRVSRKELRRRWLRRWLRLTEDGTLPESGAAGEVDPAAVEARDAVNRYYAILDHIGGEARTMFVTRYIEGLELTEVARLYGLSVSTTQRRLGRVSKRVDAMVRRDPLLAEIADQNEGGTK